MDERGAHAASVEVTKAVHQARFDFAIRLDRAGGAIWDAPGIGPAWMITFGDHIDPRKVDRQALFDLCRRANEEEDPRVIHTSTSWRNEQKAMGIDHMLRRLSETELVYISPASVGWFGMTGHVTEQVNIEAANNQAKLERAPPPRHLLVDIDPRHYPLIWELWRHGPAPDPVPLPAWIDVAWAAYDDVILWRATNGQSWEIIQSEDDYWNRNPDN